jgi:hypothetical protein
VLINNTLCASVSSVLLRKAQHIAPWFSFFEGSRSGFNIPLADLG